MKRRASWSEGTVKWVQWDAFDIKGQLLMHFPPVQLRPNQINILDCNETAARNMLAMHVVHNIDVHLEASINKNPERGHIIYQEGYKKIDSTYSSMSNKYHLGSYSISERAAKIGKLHAKDFQSEPSSRKNQGESNSVLPHLSKEYENFYNQNGYIGIYNQCDRREKLKRFSEKRKHFRRRKKTSFDDHGESAKRVDETKKDKRLKNVLISLQQNKRRKQLNNMISQAGVQADSISVQYGGFHGNKFYPNMQDSKISNSQVNTNQQLSHNINIATYTLNEHAQNSNHNNTIKNALDRTSLRPLSESTPSCHNNFITSQIPKDSRLQIQHSILASHTNQFVTNQYAGDKLNNNLVGNNKTVSSNISFPSTLPAMPNTTNTQTNNIKVPPSSTNIPTLNLTNAPLTSSTSSYNSMISTQTSNFLPQRPGVNGSMTNTLPNKMPPTRHNNNSKLKSPIQSTLRPNTKFPAMLTSSKINNHTNNSMTSNLSPHNYNNSLSSTSKSPVLYGVNSFSNHNNSSTGQIGSAPMTNKVLPLQSSETCTKSNISNNFKLPIRETQDLTSHFYPESKQMISTSKPIAMKTKNMNNCLNDSYNHNDNHGNSIIATSLPRNSTANINVSTSLQSRPVLDFEAKNKGVQKELSTSMVSSHYKVHELNKTPSKSHANNFCDVGIFGPDALSKSGAPKPPVTQLGKNSPNKIDVNKPEQNLSAAASHNSMKPFIPKKPHMSNISLSTTPSLMSNSNTNDSNYKIISPLTNTTAKYASSMEVNSSSNTMKNGSISINPPTGAQSSSFLSSGPTNTLTPLKVTNVTDNLNVVNSNQINKDTSKTPSLANLPTSSTPNWSFSSSTFSLANVTKEKESTNTQIKLSKIESMSNNNNLKSAAPYSKSNPQYVGTTNQGPYDGMIGTSLTLTKRSTNKMEYCKNPSSELNTSSENVALAMTLADMPSHTNDTIKALGATNTKNQADYHSPKANISFAQTNEKAMKIEMHSQSKLPRPFESPPITKENENKPSTTKNDKVVDTRNLCNIGDLSFMTPSYENKVPSAFEPTMKSSAPLLNTETNNTKTLMFDMASERQSLISPKTLTASTNQELKTQETGM